MIQNTNKIELVLIIIKKLVVFDRDLFGIITMQHSLNQQFIQIKTVLFYF